MVAIGALVGRRAEIDHVLRTISGTGCRGVLLLGEAGIGKTRLAEELCRRLEQRADVVVVRLFASEALSEIPRGVFADVLPASPSTAPDLTTSLAQAISSLRARAGNRRLVVSVDDAPALDPLSMAIIDRICRLTQFTVLLTGRTEQAREPLHRLWRENIVERIDVRPLDRRCSRQLLEATFGGPVTETLAEALWQRSAGNPLVLRELVLAARGSGALLGADGRWDVGRLPTSTPRLRDLVADRIARLSRAAETALELAAVAGVLPVAAVTALGVEDGAAEAERAGLLVSDFDGRRLRLRLSHPLYGDVLTAMAGEVTVRRHKRRLANWLDATSMCRQDDLLRVLTWRLQAGVALDADRALAGAWAARGRWDMHLAEQLARAAVEAGGGPDARHALGTALADLGRAAEAEEELAAAWTAGTAQTRVACGPTRAYNLYFGLGRWVDAMRLMDEIREAAGDPAAKARAIAVQAALLLMEGRVSEALSSALPVAWNASIPATSRVAAAAAAMPALAGAGRVEEAIRLANEIDPMLAEVLDQQPEGVLQVRWPRGYGLLLAGRLAEAEALAEREYPAAVEQGLPSVIGGWAHLLGLIALTRGQLAQAAHWLRTSAEYALRRDVWRAGRLVLADLARTLAQSGDATAADAAIRQAEALGRERPAVPWAETWFGLARLWVDAATMDTGSIGTVGLRLAAEAEARGQAAEAVSVLYDIARLGAAGTVLSALKRLAGVVEGPAVQLYCRQVAAMTAGDAAELERVAAALSNLGARLLSAEALAQAARLHRRRGDDTAARAAATRCELLLDGCGPVRPLLVGAPQVPDRLTPREWEVAGLATQGLTSRQIAERLVISVRTVDNTLYRIYSKAGVTSRAELRQLLDPSKPCIRDPPLSEISRSPRPPRRRRVMGH